MTSENQVLIKIDAMDESSELFFQDFSKTDINRVHIKAESNDFQEEKTSANYSMWSLEYFKRFFDVDTSTVIERIIRSIYVMQDANNTQNYIKFKPDLYGPFWICVTLVFTIAISGNMANYLQAASKQQAYHWKYDFHVVSASATVIFLYAWFVPLVLWSILKYKGCNQFQTSLLELMCIYGYSLSVYIPISVLWIIQINLIQWILVFIGTSSSGYVLMKSISPAFGEKNFLFPLLFLCLHILLAVGFMLYFFHVPPIKDEKN